MHMNSTIEKCRKNPNYNDFLCLVVCFGNETVTEEDLKWYLNKRMDIVEKIYDWFFFGIVASIVVALGALLSVHYFTKLRLPFTIELYIFASVVIAIIVLVFVLQQIVKKRIGSIRPLVAQTCIMIQYLEAKAELKRRKSSSIPTKCHSIFE